MVTSRIQEPFPKKRLVQCAPEKLIQCPFCIKTVLLESSRNNKALVLSSAASHNHFLKLVSVTSDGFYTLDKLDAEKTVVPMCSCAARSKMIESGTSWVMNLQMMIRSSIPLTDDGGKNFCSAVLQRILEYAHSEGQLHALSSGSEFLSC